MVRGVSNRLLGDVSLNGVVRRGRFWEATLLFEVLIPLRRKLRKGEFVLLPPPLNFPSLENLPLPPKTKNQKKSDLATN